jgi:hypothetical protein
MNARQVPILEEEIEVECLKSYKHYLDRGFKPLKIRLRSSDKDKNENKVLKSFKFPEKIGCVYGKNKVELKFHSQVEAYKLFSLDGRNEKCLEELRDWWSSKFSGSWKNIVKDFYLLNIEKNVILHFSRKETHQNPIEYSLQLIRVCEKNAENRWKKENKYTESKIQEFVLGLTDQKCTLDTTWKPEVKPKCGPPRN